MCINCYTISQGLECMKLNIKEDLGATGTATALSFLIHLLFLRTMERKTYINCLLTLPLQTNICFYSYSYRIDPSPISTASSPCKIREP